MKARFSEIAETIVFAVISAFLLVATVSGFKQGGFAVGALLVLIVWSAIVWGRMFTIWDVKRELRKAIQKKGKGRT